MGISMPFVELSTTLELSTGAMAISVALRIPYCNSRLRRPSQSKLALGVKSVSSLTPLALRSQGKIPLP